MKATTTTLISLFFLPYCLVSGFESPQMPSRGKTNKVSSSSSPQKLPLYVGSTSSSYHPNYHHPRQETEQDARFLLMKAKQVAYSDESQNLQDLELLLREMLHVQSGCAAGTLVGHDICDEQDVAADVVARLRHKIEVKKREHHTMQPHIVAGSESLIPMIATELAVGALMLIVAVFWTTLDMTHRHGVAPLTAQEWWWSLQDGYVANLVEYYFKAGAQDLVV